MTRNLRAFGLVLVAAMALGAIGAQGASAVVEHSFRSGSNDTVLTGANESYTTGGSKDLFTITAGVNVECDATFERTHVGQVLDATTVHPKYHNCNSSLGGAATIHTGGCNYIFDSDTTQASGHSSSSEHAAWSIECEAGHVIEVTTPGCNIAIGATHNSVAVNQSLHGVKYTQITHSSKHALTVTATIRTIHYTGTFGSLCGLAGHPAGTYSNGSYDSKATMTGYDSSTLISGSTTVGRVWSHGAQIDISVSTPT